MKRFHTLALSLTSASVLSSATAAAADWTQYNGTNSDRATTEQLPSTKLPKKPAWKTSTNTGFSSFTVAGGKAYTLVRDEIEGIEREICLALDAASGKPAWKSELTVLRYGHDGGNSGARDNKGGDGPRSTPTIDNGHVYVIDSDINLFCLDANSGDKIWSVSVLKDHDGENIKWKNAASPLIDGNLVYLAGGGKNQALLAFDKTTGKNVWKAESDAMTHATPIATTIHGQRQIIFFTQEGLVALTADKGDVLWRYDFPFKVSTAASPVVDGDIVFCSAGYGVGGGAVKINKSGSKFTADEIWRKDNDVINHWSTPLVIDGHLYGMFSFKKYGTGPLACVDIKTGKQLWAEDGFGPGNVTRAGNKLIALSDSGSVVIVDPSPEGYQELSRTDVLDGKCWSSPILANGSIYARSTEQAVRLDLK
ncbi:MAG: PQQ-like beta-propeller repeat protein [Verrucomicrobiales bacterium]|nr:PQQ-like beta-propeller repeat protein [Verrucomicrobiales bacterium]